MAHLNNIDVVGEDEERQDHDDTEPEEDGALPVGRRVERGRGSRLDHLVKRIEELLALGVVRGLVCAARFIWNFFCTHWDCRIHHTDLSLHIERELSEIKWRPIYNKMGKVKSRKLE